jgi:hypothetical protein
VCCGLPREECLRFRARSNCIRSLGIRAARRRGRGSLHPIGISEVHTQGSVKGRYCEFAFEVELGESKLWGKQLQLGIDHFEGTGEPAAIVFIRETRGLLVGSEGGASVSVLVSR